MSRTVEKFEAAFRRRLLEAVAEDLWHAACREAEKEAEQRNLRHSELERELRDEIQVKDAELARAERELREFRAKAARRNHLLGLAESWLRETQVHLAERAQRRQEEAQAREAEAQAREAEEAQAREAEQAEREKRRAELPKLDDDDFWGKLHRAADEIHEDRKRRIRRPVVTGRGK